MEPGSKKTRKYDLEDRLIKFSLMIIGVVEALPDNRICGHLGGQLLRSGTSPAFNYGEAQAAESRKDFIHKLQVVLKELRESFICIKILKMRSLLEDENILNECEELISIFNTSIATARGQP